MARPRETRAAHRSTTLAEVAGAKRGAEHAWDHLYARLAPWLIERLERRAMPAEITAEDLVQEVMIEAFRTLDRFVVEPDSSFRAWLATIAELRRKDALRRAASVKRGGREVRVSLDPHDTQQSGAQVEDPRHASQTMLARVEELRSVLDQVLADMDSKKRRILELRMLEDRSFAEIQVVMGFRCEASVRSFYMRSRKLLSDRLGAFDTTGA